jgi:hypothetical protein
LNYAARGVRSNTLEVLKKLFNVPTTHSDKKNQEKQYITNIFTGKTVKKQHKDT